MSADRGGRAPGPLRAEPWPAWATGARPRDVTRPSDDDQTVRRRRHRGGRGRHRHRPPAGAAIACAPCSSSGPTTSAPAPRRPTPPSSTPGSTPSRAASSPPWSGAATRCSRLRPRRGHRATRRRAPSWWPGTTNRRPGSTTCWPRPGPTGTSDAEPGLTLEELARTRAASRARGHRSRAPSPTSRSSARGARASPSPPRRSLAGVELRLGVTVVTDVARDEGGVDPVGTTTGPVRAGGWSTRPASARTGSTSVRPRRVHHRARGADSSSSSTSWPGPLVSSIVLPVPTPTHQGRPGGADRLRQRAVGPHGRGHRRPGRTRPPRQPASTALFEAGRRIVPALVDEEVTATYAGVRAATEHRDYQITVHEPERYACVGGHPLHRLDGVAGHRRARRRARWGRPGSRSSEAEHEPAIPRLPELAERGLRAFEDPDKVRADPAYGHIVCFCERVTEGEVRDALGTPVPAVDLGRRAAPHPGHQRALSGLLLRRGHRGPVGDAGGTMSRTARAGRRAGRAAPARPAWPRPRRCAAGGAGRVLVVDREDEAGGTPRLCAHTGFGLQDLRRVLSGPAYARRWVDAGRRRPASTSAPAPW